MTKHPLHLIVCGQVDHGKSTLIGRLLFETGSLTDAKIQEIEQAALKRGSEMEWAFALDSLQIERSQGITLDTTRIWLKREERDVVIIDAPGHHELLRNMLTGAATADAALLLVDAMEGVTLQAKKHAELLGLLGISQVLVLINKMDAIGFSEHTFNTLVDECRSIFKRNIPAIPISAKQGENITVPSAAMLWYEGSPLLPAIDALQTRSVSVDAPFRMTVQDVMRVDSERVLVGRISSGSVQLGDVLYFSPSGSTATLKSFKSWPDGGAPKTVGHVGESVALVLETPVFCDRGEVISGNENPPIWLSKISATIVWLAAKTLQLHDVLSLRIGTQTLYAEVMRMDVEVLHTNDIGRVGLKLRGVAVVDSAQQCVELSRFVLVDTNGQICAAGFVDLAEAVNERHAKTVRKSDHITPFDQPISAAMFEERNGHKGGIFWFSGLSGAGKSTLAIELQKLLFARGKQVIILDGDNMRKGLSRDLGFSEQDRRENIRRAAEVAHLLADSGIIVLTAFITPTEEDRELVSACAPDTLYHIYIKADLDLCESRDAKGLYKLARAGKIAEFTGISAPFEEPVFPDFIVDTSLPLAECITKLLGYIEQHTMLD
jgi:bifunctional enzyme CysN/CysC